MRLPHSLTSTHWVMWSSPVLLLVLVFTWTASSSSTPAHHLGALSGTPPTTRPTGASLTPSTTIPVTSTTSPAGRATVRAPARATRRRKVPPRHPTPTALSTNAARVKSSSSVTDSNAKSNVSASAANGSSGVVGQLSATFNVADVPLQGPGTWEVATSAPASVTLTCAGAVITVDEEFVIAAHTTCLVELTAEAPNHFVTWELTPTN